MEKHAMSIFLIALAIPVMLWGVRMNRLHKTFLADVVKRSQEGRSQLDGQTLQYWTDNLGRSASTLYRYQRLLEAEAQSAAGNTIVDTRPFADRAPDPEAYTVRVIALVALVSLVLTCSVLTATQSVAITLGFLSAAMVTGLLAVKPLLSPTSKRRNRGNG